ncbi:MAG: hypothetical protein ACF8XB_08780 [Planctomycetota bacterium JB042]
MMTSPPETELRDGVLRVSAALDPAAAPGRLPDRLWFEVDASLAPFVRERADAFAAVLHLPALALGRPLDILGPVSPALLGGIERRQEVFRRWSPPGLRPIEVRAAERRPAGPSGDGVLSSFSGGVDSFHTIWSRRPRDGAPAAGRVTDAVFLHGFDIPLDERSAYERAASAYEEVLAPLGVRLIRMRTNARDLRGVTRWGLLHGAVLAAAPLLLGGLASRFLVPSTDNGRGRPWGTHPELDPWLGTEALTVTLDGDERDRAGKVAEIMEWPEALENLRVCLRRSRSAVNCCRCEKCVRTMILLDLAGGLARGRAFPKRLRPRHVRRTRFEENYVEGTDVVRLLLRRAWGARRFDLVRDLCWSLLRSRLFPSGRGGAGRRPGAGVGSRLVATSGGGRADVGIPAGG